jgi:UDP-N-acetylglucosamine 4-epimerase
VGNLLAGEPCKVNGDGESSRDFTYIDNVVQANLLAAVVQGEGVTDQVYNVAAGGRTTLNDLFQMIRDGLAEHQPELSAAEPMYAEFRPGDVRHSLADISKIRARLGYAPTQPVELGLREALGWYISRLAGSPETTLA